MIRLRCIRTSPDTPSMLRFVADDKGGLTGAFIGAADRWTRGGDEVCCTLARVRSARATLLLVAASAVSRAAAEEDIIMLNRSGPLRLSERIHQILRERGMANRGLITGLGERHFATGYRLLSGKTSDPWISTVLEVCQALALDPDELLQVSRAELDPELQTLLDEVRRLDEEDRWMLIDLLRSIRRRSTR